MVQFGKAALCIACLIGAGLLGGCNQTTRSVFGYQVPESDEPLPADYPNVYTTISRDDELRSTESKEAVIQELENERSTHVPEAQQEING